MNLKKELPLFVIILLPIAYLIITWDKLPNKVPLHWNIKGEIDRYGNKTELLLITILLPLLTYITFLVIPKIDPKNKLNSMGKKFQALKFIMTVFVSSLVLYIIYSVKNNSLTNSNYIILLFGILYIILGNYFKTIKANYFIGIRTPWTLENETVWKKTHKLSGIIWFIAGIFIVFLSLTLDNRSAFLSFIIITGLITITPLIYSYLIFKKENN